MAYSYKLTKEEIYRDSNKFYAQLSIGQGYSKSLLNFCSERAGKRILDFGCATGDYCLGLGRLGFECVGVDINAKYIKIAREKGVEAFVVKGHLPFDDNSFDTVIMFELLEHVQDPGKILEEAKRVARKNILITVPNCGSLEILRSYGLIYDHFLEMDHNNFFTKKDLENLLARNFKKFKVEEKEPILLGKAGLPWWLRKPVSLLYKLKFIKTNIYYRLFSVVDLDEEL